MTDYDRIDRIERRLDKIEERLDEIRDIFSQGKGVTLVFRIAMVVLGSGGAIALIGLLNQWSKS